MTCLQSLGVLFSLSTASRDTRSPTLLDVSFGAFRQAFVALSPGDLLEMVRQVVPLKKSAPEVP